MQVDLLSSHFFTSSSPHPPPPPPPPFPVLLLPLPRQAALIQVGQCTRVTICFRPQHCRACAVISDQEPPQTRSCSQNLVTLQGPSVDPIGHLLTQLATRFAFGHRQPTPHVLLLAIDSLPHTFTRFALGHRQPAPHIHTVHMNSASLWCCLLHLFPAS